MSTRQLASATSPFSPHLGRPPVKRRLTSRYLAWSAATAVARVVPAIHRGMPLYTDLQPAEAFGRVERVTSTEPLALDPRAQAFARHLPHTLPDPVPRELILLSVDGASLVGRTGRILDEQRRWVLQTSKSRPMVTYNDLRPLPSRRVTPSGGPWFSMVHSAVGHRHLFHFLIDRLQYVHAWLHRFGAAAAAVPTTVLTNEDLPGFQQTAWQVLHARHPWMRCQAVPAGERWQLEGLQVCDVRQPIKSTFCDPGFIDFLRGLYLEAFGLPTHAQGWRRLYVSRRDARKRRPHQEAAIEAALGQRGFESVALAQMPFAEQVRLFTEAQTVVGVHGAGLTHMAFAPASTQLVELFPSTKVKDTYFLLCHRRGLAYRGVIGGPGDRREGFDLDPAAVLAALDSF